MSRIVFPLFGSFFLLLTTSGSMQEARNRTEIVVEHGIVFGKGGDKDLKLDLARPKDEKGLYPVVVCIHGGGWVGGDREQLAQTIDTFARYGFVAVSPDYRLAPQDPFPAPLEDCKAAIRWLRANAKKYNGNPDRIGVIGFSAGGHLACLLGVTDKSDGLEGKGGNAEESSRVQAVVSFFGPTDLASDDFGPVAIKTNLVPLMGGTKAEKPDLYKKASPLSYSMKDAPPFLFFHGSADKVVSPDQSRRMGSKLNEAGRVGKLVTLDGEGHGWRGEPLRKSIDEALSFLHSCLR